VISPPRCGAPPRRPVPFSQRLFSTPFPQRLLRSGAGKTEATKYILEYLATVAGGGGDGAASGSGGGPQELLLDSSPIIEAFGNAKTTRNNNSSRFGKYIEVLFDGNSTIIGGNVTKYLLEKSRIVGQPDGERNYHIFTMLFRLDRAIRQKLWLSVEGEHVAYGAGAGAGGGIGDFAYLGGAADGSLVPDSAQHLTEVCAALTRLGVPSGEGGAGAGADVGQDNVWAAVAATLWLGNLRFQPLSGGGSDGCEPIVHLTAAGETALSRAATLLAVDQDSLKRCVVHPTEVPVSPSHCFLYCCLVISHGPGGGWTLPLSCCLMRRMVTKTEGILEIPNGPLEAEASRDAIAKAVYARIFDWVIDVVDRAIRAPASGGSGGGGGNSGAGSATQSTVIGVLDIFGFESFETNRFEQLCINYANEKLQFHFNEEVFALELEDYRKQGLHELAQTVSYTDNAGCIALVEHSRNGILRAIDDEIGMQGSDDSLLVKLNQQCGTHDFYGQPRPRADPGFVVRHYAKDVAYVIQGFIEKNKDMVQPDVMEVLRASTQPLVRRMFSEAFEATCTVAVDAGTPRSQAKGKATLGAQFKTSLGHLYSALQATKPHFVKCIKPNDHQQNSFDSKFTLYQLRYLGLLEVIRIRQSGYPIRLQIREALGRYRCVLRAHGIGGRPHHGERDKDQISALQDFVTSKLAAAKDTKPPKKSSWRSRQKRGQGDRSPDAGQSPKKAADDDVAPMQVGSSMVFLKDSAHALLEEQRSIEVVRSVTQLQGWIKEVLTVKQNLRRCAQAGRCAQTARRGRGVHV
jgi:myosin heavy subunit